MVKVFNNKTSFFTAFYYTTIFIVGIAAVYLLSTYNRQISYAQSYSQNVFKKKDYAESMTLLKNIPKSRVKGLSLLGNALNPIIDDSVVLDEVHQSNIISTYIVKEGDSISSIAKMFNVSVNTVLWSNNLTRKSALKPGQNLVILPITGVNHEVVKGDTIAGIAKKYGADQGEIEDFNGLESDNDLIVGNIIIVPDGEIEVKVTPKRNNPLISVGSTALKNSVLTRSINTSDYFSKPVKGYVRTRGIHGWNGVDLANSIGTPIYAAAEGKVIIAKGSGWNGGYGSYVVISHPNGLQTLYGHLSSVDVSEGDDVNKGEEIGKMGSTGKSTGPHLHFEVRGGINPF